MSGTIRIAAAGDVHAAEELRERLARVFGEIAEQADVVLLAGDLTTHGLPEQAGVLADACAGVSVPLLAVLGNHDHHSGRADEVRKALEAGGIVVLDRSHVVLELGNLDVGIVGTKGFVGGFAGAEIPDFGEPALRRIYQETSEEVEALEAVWRRSQAATNAWSCCTTPLSPRRSSARPRASGPSSAPVVPPGRSGCTDPTSSSTATPTTEHRTARSGPCLCTTSPGTSRVRTSGSSSSDRRQACGRA
jgi:hypothetical protein